MSRSTPSPAATRPGESTVAYPPPEPGRSAGTDAALAAMPTRLDPGLDASCQQEREVRSVLQHRLAGLLPVGAAVTGSMFLTGLTDFDPSFSREQVGWAPPVLLALATAVAAGGAVLVRMRPVLSLCRLRALELLVFAFFAAAVAALRIALFTRGLTGGAEGPASEFFLNWAAVYNGFGWLGLTVVYGVSIPNTRRRTLVMVFFLNVAPVLIDAGFLLYQPAWLAKLAYPLLMTAQMLAVGMTVALFGSFKMGALQQEVLQARREARAARALGPYVLKRQLGAGGMGEVFLAEHRLLKRPCAVKLVRPERAGDPEILARFDREVRATARLKHPNTVDVFDYGRHEDGTFYYVMEYLDGIGLDELVGRHGPLPAARVAHILRQICGALHEAHGLGLIHRDIKPSNILLCRHGGYHDVAKLVDFGLVQTAAAGEGANKLTQVGSLLGTPDFMAPEQADGSSLDVRSDLYSLGATAFYLLSGRPPFQGKTVLDVLFAHRHEPVPPLPGVPGGLETVVRRCLAKSPADRYASVADVERDLRQRCVEWTWTEEEARACWETRSEPGV
jgi:hypothetical protein